MVPASQTYRWQCWDEHGKPVDVQRPRKNGLNGWVASGLGQTIDVSSLPSDVVDTSAASDPFSLQSLSQDIGYVTTPTTTTSPSSAPSMSSGFNLTSFLNSLTADAAGTTTAYLKAQTAQQLAASGATATANIINTILPMAMLGLGAWLLISLIQSRQH